MLHCSSLEEMTSPLYVGDIYVLLGDFVLLCVSFMLKNYEQHNEVKSFFADILYKLWENGILSTADIYAHGGPWSALNFPHIMHFRSVENIQAPLRLTRLASKKSFLGKKRTMKCLKMKSNLGRQFLFFMQRKYVRTR